TTTGSSTSTPTAITSPNITIMLMVMPSALATRKAIMKDSGMDRPIISAGRTPSVAIQVISTSATAVSTAASSERNRAVVVSAWSRKKEYVTPEGQSLAASSVVARTLSDTSMILVP